MGAGSDGGSGGTPAWETLADLGEWELIRRLEAFAPDGQFADDAAVLSNPLPPGSALVVNTDVLVEGIHFSDRTTEPRDVGWRAAVANLSDLAAMGALDVVGLTVGLVAPASTPWTWVRDVYAGLSEALTTYGGILLGGDCSGGNQRLLAITAIGRIAHEGEAIRRGDGRPGDLLVSTGPHGLSRLGLALLQESPLGRDPESQHPILQTDLEQRAIHAHRRPSARLDAVRSLVAARPAALPWRVGGCDSSDGLAAAVRAIAASSRCEAWLDLQSLPIDPAMEGLETAESWCLGGGEDFELILALEPGWAHALIDALPGSSIIGGLHPGEAGRLAWSHGSPLDSGATGFSHFH